MIESPGQRASPIPPPSWRVEHERFWTEELFPGWEDPPVLDDDTQVVVEWFCVRD
jgi:uncharacterized protein YhfF